LNKNPKENIDIGTVSVIYQQYVRTLELIHTALQHNTRPLSIGYANQHTIVLSSKNKKFDEVLRKHFFVLADGIGVHWAANFLEHFPRKQYKLQNATDLNHKILEFAHLHSKKVFILGSNNISLKKFAKNIHAQFPKIHMVGLCEGYANIHSMDLIKRINTSKPDLLLVGLGQPAQELWYSQYHQELSVPATIMVGGFIDFFSGYKRRAPKLFRLLGFEWFFRLLQEPRRLWKRYLVGIPQFIIIILKQRFKK